MGLGKKLAKQQADIAEFFHGKSPHQLCQIQMLSSAALSYRDMHEEVSSMVTKKDDNVE